MSVLEEHWTSCKRGPLGRRFRELGSTRSAEAVTALGAQYVIFDDLGCTLFVSIKMPDVNGKQRVLVVGAGPVGALAALYAARRGDDVAVYDLRDGNNLGLFYDD